MAISSIRDVLTVFITDKDEPSFYVKLNKLNEKDKVEIDTVSVPTYLLDIKVNKNEDAIKAIKTGKLDKDIAQRVKYRLGSMEDEDGWNLIKASIFKNNIREFKSKKGFTPKILAEMVKFFEQDTGTTVKQIWAHPYSMRDIQKNFITRKRYEGIFSGFYEKLKRNTVIFPPRRDTLEQILRRKLIKFFEYLGSKNPTPPYFDFIKSNGIELCTEPFINEGEFIFIDNTDLGYFVLVNPVELDDELISNRIGIVVLYPEKIKKAVVIKD